MLTLLGVRTPDRSEALEFRKPFCKEKGQRLWVKWRLPESPPAQDKCVTALLRPRGSSQVWQHSQNMGGFTDPGKQSSLLRTRGKFPLVLPLPATAKC